ncbi:MAG: RHS repeat-associated core domain-containing protein [Bacteroidia bacterium]|nr:RHS repeat-associated core domain-containing protein [Bacteroidia bacterium]
MRQATKNQATLRYEYYLKDHVSASLKDHLWNVRFLFTDTDTDGVPEILQEDAYDPWGIRLAGLSYTQGEKNRFLYNGKEQVKGLGWYDYGARMYDPATGRWNGVDGLAEKYIGISPYVYCMDNPVLFLDVDGNEWINPYVEMAKNTENKALKNEYNRLASETNNLLKTLEDNDPELYNYINDLKITDKEGNESPLNVYLFLNEGDNANRPFDGRTTWSSLSSKIGDFKVGENITGDFQIKLDKSKEDGQKKSKWVQGIQVNVWNIEEKRDVFLANEAGDVMFAVNNYTIAWNTNNIDSNGKLKKNYATQDSQNYSNNVEYIYTRRKNGTLDKSIKIYPLDNKGRNDERVFKKNFEEKFPTK